MFSSKTYTPSSPLRLSKHNGQTDSVPKTKKYKTSEKSPLENARVGPPENDAGASTVLQENGRINDTSIPVELMTSQVLTVNSTANNTVIKLVTPPTQSIKSSNGFPLASHVTINNNTINGTVPNPVPPPTLPIGSNIDDQLTSHVTLNSITNNTNLNPVPTPTPPMGSNNGDVLKGHVNIMSTTNNTNLNPVPPPTLPIGSNNGDVLTGHVNIMSTTNNTNFNPVPPPTLSIGSNIDDRPTSHVTPNSTTNNMVLNPIPPPTLPMGSDNGDHMTSHITNNSATNNTNLIPVPPPTLPMGSNNGDEQTGRLNINSANNTNVPPPTQINGSNNGVQLTSYFTVKSTTNNTYVNALPSPTIPLGSNNGNELISHGTRNSMPDNKQPPTETVGSIDGDQLMSLDTIHSSIDGAKPPTPPAPPTPPTQMFGSDNGGQSDYFDGLSNNAASNTADLSMQRTNSIGDLFGNHSPFDDRRRPVISPKNHLKNKPRSTPKIVKRPIHPKKEKKKSKHRKKHHDYSPSIYSSQGLYEQNAGISKTFLSIQSKHKRKNKNRKHPKKKHHHQKHRRSDNLSSSWDNRHSKPKTVASLGSLRISESIGNQTLSNKFTNYMKQPPPALFLSHIYRPNSVLPNGVTAQENNFFALNGLYLPGTETIPSPVNIANSNFHPLSIVEKFIQRHDAPAIAKSSDSISLMNTFPNMMGDRPTALDPIEKGNNTHFKNETDPMTIANQTNTATQPKAFNNMTVNYASQSSTLGLSDANSSTSLSGSSSTSSKEIILKPLDSTSPEKIVTFLKQYGLPAMLRHMFVNPTKKGNYTHSKNKMYPIEKANQTNAVQQKAYPLSILGTSSADSSTSSSSSSGTSSNEIILKPLNSNSPKKILNFLTQNGLPAMIVQDGLSGSTSGGNVLGSITLSIVRVSNAGVHISIDGKDLCVLQAFLL